MDLEQTLRKMKENEDTFYPLVESMKRRADKGLIEGVTSADIDATINKIENGTSGVEEISMLQEMFELSEAIEKFGYLDIDSWSENELETGILYEFVNDVMLLERRDEEDYSTPEEERRKKIKKWGHGIVGGTAAFGLTHNALLAHGRKVAAANIEAAKTAATAKAIASGAGNALAAKAGTDAAAAAGAKLINKAPILAGAHNVIGGVAKGIGTVGKAVGTAIKNFAVANPLAAGITGGVALGIGALKLISHLRKRRQQQLTESELSTDLIFSENFKMAVNEALAILTVDEIEFLKENASDDTREILSLIQKPVDILDEAVTFIDAAGNLKTTTTADYIEAQYEGDMSTQIAKYEKKKKIKDYKLLSEEVDIDSLRKLSEMSLEDILNEDLLS